MNRTFPRPTGLRRGFTLTEVLVVVVIIIVLVLLALPAFNAMSESQGRAASEARLGGALGAARDAAITGGAGADTAAVFAYEVGGPQRVIICRRVGEISDTTVNPARSYDIFVPDPTIEPTSMPEGWTVRGYAPSWLFTPQWYGNGTPARYSNGTGAVGSWVFPETGFYNHGAMDDGASRCTFMVRFVGGSGELAGTRTRPSLILLPAAVSGAVRADLVNRQLNITEGTPREAAFRVDRLTDYTKYVRQVITDPYLSAQDRLDLLGPRSTDMVLARPVMSLAIAEEEELANALGVRLDRNSGTVYQVLDNELRNGAAPNLAPRFITGVNANRIAQWIEGESALNGNEPNGSAQRAESVESRIYTIDRITGTLQQVTIPGPP